MPNKERAKKTARCGRWIMERYSSSTIAKAGDLFDLDKPEIIPELYEELAKEPTEEEFLILIEVLKAKYHIQTPPTA